MKIIKIKNIWLKILALFLAVVVWFYISGELKKESDKEANVLERILPYKVAAKRVPIKATVVGKAIQGYSVEYQNITLDPDMYVIVGPRNIIDNIYYVTTEPIDISEFTKPVSRRVEIQPIGSGIDTEGRMGVVVNIPIIRKKQEIQLNSDQAAPEE